MPSQGSARIDSLTGLRIFAAVAVFLSHLQPPAFAPEVLRRFMGSGYNGVTLFFILSGFVMAWNYTDRLTPLRVPGLWSFVVARFARIYPLYIFALVFAVAPALLDGKIAAGAWQHVLAIQVWNPDPAIALGMNGPGWSINVEFFLYACFPVLVVALARIRRSPRALLAVGAASIVVMTGLAWWFVLTGRASLQWGDAQSAHRWLYLIPLTRLGDFVLGIITAMLVQNPARPPSWLPATAQMIGVVGFVSLMIWPGMLVSAWSWDSAYMLPVFLILWGLATGPSTMFARLLATKPLVRAGEASFAFYLLHGSLVGRFTFASVDNWREWAFATTLEFFAIFFLALGAHMVIERPAQRWLRRVLDRNVRVWLQQRRLRRMRPSEPEPASENDQTGPTVEQQPLVKTVDTASR